MNRADPSIRLKPHQLDGSLLMDDTPEEHRNVPPLGHPAAIGLDEVGRELKGNAVTTATSVYDARTREALPTSVDVGAWGVGITPSALAPVGLALSYVKASADDDGIGGVVAGATRRAAARRGSPNSDVVPYQLWLWGLVGLVITACGGGPGGPGGDLAGPGGDLARPEGGRDGVASGQPPLFAYSPMPPGRAVGIHAIVETPSGEVRTGEVEIDLRRAGDVQQAPSAVTEPMAPSVTDGVGPVGLQAAALCEKPGTMPTSLRTDPFICWMISSGGINFVGTKRASNKAMIFGADGAYYTTFVSEEIVNPVDALTEYDFTTSVGCLASASDVEPTILTDLTGYGVSGSLPLFGGVAASFGMPFGVTVFELDNRTVPAIQFNMGVSFGVGGGLHTLASPISVSIGTRSATQQLPTLVAASPLCRDMPFAGAEEAPLDTEAMADIDTEIDDALGPLGRELFDNNGAPPGPHVSAENTAGAIRSLGEGGFETGCADCPGSSLDDLIAQTHAAFDASSGAEVIAAVPAVLAQVPNSLPSVERLRVLVRRARSGLDMSEAKERQQAHNDLDTFVGSGVLTINSIVGHEVTLRFSAQEVAHLLHVDVADVIDATLTVDGSPQIEPASFGLPESGLELRFTPQTSDPVFVATRVDLSTAAGTFPQQVLEGYVELVPRLIKPQAGPVEAARISSPKAVASGGAVALNVAVTDGMGNPTDEVTRVWFEDGQGNMLGMAETEYGVATLHFVPEASTPALTGAEQVELQREDGSALRGTRLTGNSISVDVSVYANGELLDRDTVARQVTASEVLLATELPVGTPVYLENPGSMRSHEVTVSSP